MAAAEMLFLLKFLLLGGGLRNPILQKLEIFFCASLLLSARCWWKRLNIWKLVIFTLFLKFLDGTIGRAMDTATCHQGEPSQPQVRSAWLLLEDHLSPECRNPKALGLGR